MFYFSTIFLSFSEHSDKITAPLYQHHPLHHCNQFQRWFSHDIPFIIILSFCKALVLPFSAFFLSHMENLFYFAFLFINVQKCSLKKQKGKSLYQLCY